MELLLAILAIFFLLVVPALAIGAFVRAQRVRAELENLLHNTHRTLTSRVYELEQKLAELEKCAAGGAAPAAEPAAPAKPEPSAPPLKAEAAPPPAAPEQHVAPAPPVSEPPRAAAPPLRAQLLGTHFANTGTFRVRVVNPAPGGGPSNELKFTVTPRPPPGIGVIQMISVALDGGPSNGNTFTPPAISADGRFVVFRSTSTNLIPGGSNGNLQVFLARASF